MNEKTLKIYRGDDITFKLTFKDSEGTAQNITGGKIYFTAKESSNEADSLAVIQVSSSTFSDPTSGIGEVSITNSESNVDVGKYYYDIQYITGAGKISTVQTGTLEVLQDITLAET